MMNYLMILTILDLIFHFVLTSEFYNCFETNIENAPLTKLAINEETDEVFVGGRNVLLHLDGELNKKNSIQLGPVNDSQECPPKHNVCIHRLSNKSVETDDNITVLMYNKQRQLLLVCGSAHQGMCFLYNPKSKKQIYFQNADEKSYIGSKNSTVIVHINGTEDIYFVAQSFDGRNLEYFYKEFSKLSLYAYARPPNYVSYKFNAIHIYAYMDVCNTSKSSFYIRFIYGFQSENYIYFLFIRSKFEGGEIIYETALAQICKDDRSFFSYVEFPIRCNRHGNRIYNIALSAHYHKTGNVNGDGGVLYVTFGISNYQSGHLEDPDEGSAVCDFSIKVIENHLIEVLRGCFIHGRGSEPDWLCGNKKQCVSQHISLDNYCGDRGQNGLQAESTKVLESTSVYSMDEELMTSVAFTNKIDPIFILGTKTGRLLKVLKGTPYKLYATIKLSQDIIQPDPVFDFNHTHMLFVTGRKVLKIPLYSCRIHSTCGECASTIDPLGCGWCVDHCSTKQMCSDTWYKNACPSFVYTISPQNGSINGNTLLTMTGKYFGSENAIRAVYLENPPETLNCTIETLQDDRLTCRTMRTDYNGTYYVKIDVSDTSRQVYPLFDIKGDSEHLFNFTYYAPQADNVTPHFGPVIGNTTLTITGKNLNIGNVMSVEVADFECKITSVRNDKVVCRTDKWIDIVPSDSVGHLILPVDCKGFGPVKVIIDKMSVNMSRNLNYCYISNPEILDIFPHKTIKSGGLVLTVEGKNFHAVTSHRVHFQFGNETSFEQKVNCSDNENGTKLACPIPRFKGSLVKGQQVISHVVLVLDGMTIFSERYKGDKSIVYFPDPVFHNISDKITINADEQNTLLELKGENINLALTPDDITIYINKTLCNVISMGNSYVKCKIDDSFIQDDLANQRYNYISVKIGNLDLTVGKIIFVHVAKSSFRKNAVVIAVCVVLSCLVLLVIMINRLGLYKRKRSIPAVANEISLSSFVTPSSLLAEREPGHERQRQDDSRYVRYGETEESRQPLLADDATGGESKLSSIDHATVTLLEKQNMLIDRNFLVLGETLGHGEFGMVYKGYLSKANEKGETEVAAKTILKAGYGNNANEFINEALRMKDFDHPNVLGLIGIALDEGEFPLVILPFMKFGDLLSYIRNENNSPTVKDLVLFGIDIARGMEYLSGIKYVHRDLAARNCMLDENTRAKVADFGLSRDVYSREYYSCDNKRKLPVKWMAPESLEKGTYTSKSDVWAYGILLWELLTRGASPYPGVENWDISRYIKVGRRLPRPEYCPEALYVTMLKCWDCNPGQRPTFKELGDKLMEIMQSKGQDSKIDEIPVELEKCTNYDYGNQNVPDWDVSLRVDMESTSRGTVNKSQTSNQVTWTNAKPEKVSICSLSDKQKADPDYSKSVKKPRISVAKFDNKEKTVQFAENVDKQMFCSVSYLNTGLDVTNGSDLQQPVQENLYTNENKDKKNL